MASASRPEKKEERSDMVESAVAQCKIICGQASLHPTEKYAEMSEHTHDSSLLKNEVNAATPTTDTTNSEETGPSMFSMTLPPNCPSIIHSATPLVDRKSVFVAHVARITQPSQVSLILGALLTNKRIRRATHNSSAYRVVEADGNIKEGCDDDGETAAGARLLHLMKALEVKNAMVVVTRWYGGVKLGAARFKCINNCAKDLLEAEGFGSTHRGSKRQKGRG
ncbi:ribosomal protein S5 domain 2-type protein [Fimicolochytrium jonesii]|uniref:ribosomal protein S5 domain 2-type protein n=1 Tax=Fimicolochytrium jonesii TaxID=1396493 RepID=UPI0022FF1308|nr:ribosomal protein S5 domain 2-type protein [Fimicolochytrium jonesii]KAI8816368.1 ribosomal protein S5 domain 2-type protein [Fimicolochytrium jonesii]